MIYKTRRARLLEHSMHAICCFILLFVDPKSTKGAYYYNTMNIEKKLYYYRPIKINSRIEIQRSGVARWLARSQLWSEHIGTTT